MKIRNSILLLAIQALLQYFILGGYDLTSLQYFNREANSHLKQLERVYEVVHEINIGILTNRRFEKDIFLTGRNDLRNRQQKYIYRFDSTSVVMNSRIELLGSLVHAY